MVTAIETLWVSVPLVPVIVTVPFRGVGVVPPPPLLLLRAASAGDNAEQNGQRHQAEQAFQYRALFQTPALRSQRQEHRAESEDKAGVSSDAGM